MRNNFLNKTINQIGLFSIFFISIFIVVFMFIQGTKKAQENLDNPVVVESSEILPKKIVEEKKAEETELPPSNNAVCEYRYKDFQTIETPEKGDDIQKIIGYQNNKAGIYIYAEIEEFTTLADELVNTNGGDWGYVLIPYNVKDTDEGRWNKVFARLREKHLIPIIQLWDLDVDNEGKMEDQINDSAKFLAKLDWPIKNRYVSVYNEVNDKKFWGGDINPKQYANVLNDTINALKRQSEDFFVMNGAFNASARTNWEYLDETEYLKQMDKEVPGIFKKLDGWASHPYPQPNFTGSATGTGRNSIRAYEWELSLLKKYGVNSIPVFITETGWPHKEGDKEVSIYLNKYQVADNIRKAYEDVWLKDDRIVAVTPFTIKYDAPHDNWSWVTKNDNPYPQYTAVKDIKKTKGKPPIVQTYRSKVWTCTQ